MIGSQDMLVGMVHSALRNDNGALADALPNHGRRLFGSQGDTTCTPSDERTMHDTGPRRIGVNTSLIPSATSCFNTHKIPINL